MSNYLVSKCLWFVCVENHNAKIKINLGFEYLVCIKLSMRGTPLFIQKIKTKIRKQNINLNKIIGIKITLIS